MLKMFYIYRRKQNMYIVSQRVLMQQLQVDEYLNEYSVLYKYDLFWCLSWESEGKYSPGDSGVASHALVYIKLFVLKGGAPFAENSGFISREISGFA